MQSFTFYDDYYRVAQKIKSKKAKQEFIYAVVAYAFEGIEPAFTNETAEIAFAGVYRSIVKQRAKSKTKTESNDNQNEIKTKSKLNQNQVKGESESDKYNLYISNSNISNISRVGESEGKGERFVPPSPDEVSKFAQTYAHEKGITLGDFSADDFCDFYASKGWMVGKNPMKDWKRACQKWVREHGSTQEVSEYAAYDQGAQTITV